MKQTFTLLIAFLLSFTWAYAQKGGKLLYNQLGDITANQYGYNSCQGYGWQAAVSYAADDFIVQEGGTEIYGATAIFDRNWMESMQVKFYADDNGVPSSDPEEVFTNLPFESVMLPSGAYQITVEFPYSVSLTTPGKYWVTIAGYGQWASAKWYLLDDANDINAKAQLNIVDDGMGVVKPWFEPVLDEMYGLHQNEDGTYNNLAFALIGAPDPNDLSVSRILAPEGGALTANDTITLEISNFGSSAQTTFDVAYQVSSTIDGVLTEIGSATETISGANLKFKETMIYTFGKKIDLSLLTTYSIKASVALNGDTNHDNDAYYCEAINYGEVHQMGVKREITTCGGVFVDNGGLNGAYQRGNDTITISPATTGARIALDFSMFNVSYWDFTTLKIYDGTSTDAPLLIEYNYGDESLNYNVPNPGFVKARNAAGALTIVYGTQDYVDGSYAGWLANVNCETANNIEFMTLGMNVGKAYEYFQKGKTTNVQAIITNAGTDTIAREVYLLENGSIISTLMTNKLIPGTLDTLNFAWTPTFVADNVNLKVLVQNDPQSTNDDNMVESSVVTYANGVLLESFENDALPLGWISKSGASVPYDYDYYSSHGTYVLKCIGSDTIVMPLMKPNVTDKLLVDATISYNTWFMLLVSKSLNGPWEHVDSALYTNYNMVGVSFDLSKYVNEPYYFAFTRKDGSSTNQTYIDNVRGATLYYYDKDLMVKLVEGPTYIHSGSETKFSTKVYNVGLNDIEGSDYVVNLRTADSIYYTVSGVDVMKGQNVNVSVLAKFANSDTLALYAEVIMNGEVRVDNNTSAKSNFYIISNYVFSPVELPGQTLGNVVVLYNKSAISEAIYYPNEIGGYGNIEGIEYTYDFGYAEIDTVPVKVFIAETDNVILVDSMVSAYSPSWIDADSLDFTMVYDGMLDFKQGNNLSLYIPFKSPFAYDGTKNIVVMVVKDSSNTVYKYPYFHSSYNDVPRFAWGANYDNQINPSNIVLSPWTDGTTNYAIPHIKWYIDNPGAPVFESMPVTMVNEYSDYNYTATVNFEGPNALVITAENLPEWLSLTSINDTTAILSGTATEIGNYSIQLMASDGIFSTTQTFNIVVNAVPTFVSTPVETVIVGADYMYTAEVTYHGQGTAMLSGGIENPAWLTVTDNGDNTATVSGKVDAAGDYNITIVAAGDVTNEQVYMLKAGTLPVIAPITDTIIMQDTAYGVTVNVAYEGVGTLTIKAGDNFPIWLTLTNNGDNTATIIGTPSGLGNYTVNVVATDGTFSASESFLVSVGAVPVFTSEPVEKVNNHEAYSYDVTVSYSGEEAIKFNASIPAWMTFTDKGDGEASLTGTPNVSGYYAVSIIAYGKYFSATQTFVINVDPNGIHSKEVAAFVIYPNPAKNIISIQASLNSTMEICDITGKVLVSKVLTTDNESVNISALNKGMYIVSVTNSKGTTSQRLVIE